MSRRASATNSSAMRAPPPPRSVAAPPSWQSHVADGRVVAQSAHCGRLAVGRAGRLEMRLPGPVSARGIVAGSGAAAEHRHEARRQEFARVGGREKPSGLGRGGAWAACAVDDAHDSQETKSSSGARCWRVRGRGMHGDGSRIDRLFLCGSVGGGAFATTRRVIAARLPDDRRPMHASRHSSHHPSKLQRRRRPE